MTGSVNVMLSGTVVAAIACEAKAGDRSVRAPEASASTRTRFIVRPPSGSAAARQPKWSGPYTCAHWLVNRRTNIPPGHDPHSGSGGGCCFRGSAAPGRHALVGDEWVATRHRPSAFQV